MLPPGSLVSAGVAVMDLHGSTITSSPEFSFPDSSRFVCLVTLNLIRQNLSIWIRLPEVVSLSLWSEVCPTHIVSFILFSVHKFASCS